MGKDRETCGRCSMTAVVETTDGEDPFAGERIEVDDADARAVSPGAWLAGLRRRLDELAARLTYGR